jgi:hypothetical protein
VGQREIQPALISIWSISSYSTASARSNGQTDPLQACRPPGAYDSLIWDSPFSYGLHLLYITNNEERSMSDLIFAICTIVFFAVSILYLRACERLK